MAKPESFEVTEYGGDTLDAFSVIKQIIEERVKESPAHSVMVSFSGEKMTLKYHCYEMHLPTRMQQVVATSEDVFRETLSYVKKEFKKRTKTVLSLKEQKDLANYSVQKVSLNERYYAIFLRVYDLNLD